MPIYPEPQWDTIYGEIIKNVIEVEEEGVEPIPDVYMVTMDVEDQFGDSYYVRRWVEEPKTYENGNTSQDWWDFTLTDIYCELREKFA